MTKGELITPLTSTEKRDWRRLQEKIGAGIDSLWDLIATLKTVRDLELYREDFASWDSYVKSIGMDKRYVNLQIKACQTRQELGTIVPTTPEAKQITTEGQLRELGNVPPEKLPEVIERAAVAASDQDKPITAKILKEAVAETIKPSTNGKPKPEPKSGGDAVIVLDAFDRPVPDHLREAASAKAALISLGSKIDPIRRELERLAGLVGGEFLPRQRLEDELKRVKREIQRAAFETECPKCRGKVDKKCTRCRGAGFVPKDLIGRLSDAEKGWLEI